MKNAFTFFICLLFVSCAMQNTKGHENDLITGEIKKLYEQKKFNGFAVSIVNENGTLYQKGFGFSNVETCKTYTSQTIQNIASVSKTFVGIALLKAQELGKLNLDDPIEKYMPFRVINPFYPEEKITIRQLAAHTSSIRDNEFYLLKNYFLKSGQNLKNTIIRFDDEQVFNPADSLLTMTSFLENVISENGKWSENSFSDKRPGAYYEYSNVGTSVAALIIEQATGIAFNDFTKQYILDPLKMHASGWKFDDVNFSDYSQLYQNSETLLPYYQCATYPDGSFITSIDDLSKFLSELIKGYNSKGTILTEESYREYFTPQLNASNFIQRDEQNPYNESYNTGIFIGFGYTGYIGHTGGDPGVVSIMFFNPKTSLGRIMVFNTSISDKAGNDVFYKIWDVLEKSSQ